MPVPEAVPDSARRWAPVIGSDCARPAACPFFTRFTPTLPASTTASAATPGEPRLPFGLPAALLLDPPPAASKAESGIEPFRLAAVPELSKCSDVASSTCAFVRGSEGQNHTVFTALLSKIGTTHYIGGGKAGEATP
eukprot:scaffold5498_cov102-Isochrysis_galbana.AAC.3